MEEAGRKAVLVPGDRKTQVTAARSWLVPSRRSGAWTSWSTTPSFQSIEEISDKEWELTFRTNIHAMFYLTKAAVPHMPEGSSEPLYRLVTTILDPAQAPAAALAALYHERWEIEGALDELKTHLRARGSCSAADPGVGRTGVLGPAAGALRRARADARGGAAGRRGSGQAVVPMPSRGPAQGAAVRGPFPLGPSASCMRRCWTKFWRSARRAAEAGRCHAGLSAR